MVGIGAGRQVDVGTTDMEEAERITSRQFRGLSPIDHVVRWCSNPGYRFGEGPPGAKWSELDMPSLENCQEAAPRSRDATGAGGCASSGMRDNSNGRNRGRWRTNTGARVQQP